MSIQQCCRFSLNQSIDSMQCISKSQQSFCRNWWAFYVYIWKYVLMSIEIEMTRLIKTIGKRRTKLDNLHYPISKFPINLQQSKQWVLVKRWTYCSTEWTRFQKYIPKCSQLVSEKSTKTIQWRKNSPFNKCAGKIEHLYAKKRKKKKRGILTSQQTKTLTQN